MLRYFYKIASVLAIFLLITNCNSGQDTSSISMQKFKSLLASDSSMVILDVRTSQELVGPLGHIEGVINIPVQILDKRLGMLEPYKEKEIYVICRSGNRSGVATKILNSNGFKAKNVLGGMKAYRTEN